MTIDLCWQSFWTFAHEYPAVVTALAFLIFWPLRFAFGHKMYHLTCWRMRDNPTRWWHNIDLHDWQYSLDPADSVSERCARFKRYRFLTSEGVSYQDQS